MRRGKAGSQPVKVRRRKATRPRAGKAATSAVSAHDPQHQLVLLMRERDEALEQQAATAEVLKVISSSPGELEAVFFRAILANATHICGAKFGTLYLRRGDAFYARAFHNAPPAFVEARKDKPLHPGPDSTLVRAARTNQVAQRKREAYRVGAILLWSPVRTLAATGQSFRYRCLRTMS